MALSMMNRWSIIGAMTLKFFAILILGLVSLAAYWFALHRDKDPRSIRITRAVLIVVFFFGIVAYTYVVLQNWFVILLQGF